MLCPIAGRKGGTTDFISQSGFIPMKAGAGAGRGQHHCTPRYLWSEECAQGRDKSPGLGSDRPRQAHCFSATRVFFLRVFLANMFDHWLCGVNYVTFARIYFLICTMNLIIIIIIITWNKKPFYFFLWVLSSMYILRDAFFDSRSIPPPDWNGSSSPFISTGMTLPLLFPPSLLSFGCCSVIIFIYLFLPFDLLHPFLPLTLAITDLLFESMRVFFCLF